MLDFQGLRRKRPPKPPAQVRTIPAPIGGWNARDALTAMKKTDAIQLDNFIPDTGGVRLRKGFAVHVTTLGSFIESLMEYNAPGVTAQLFAAIQTEIYDVSSSGAGVLAVGSLINGRWQHLMFSTPAGSYLMACNGADDMRSYDGSAWAVPAITGVSSATFQNITLHGSRLWFVQNNTLDAWYLPVASIAGAATKLPLGTFCRFGGELIAVASWTRDGGAGMDDMLVFITSKGEAVIYSGTDPSAAATWTKVGTFRIPEPIGSRCVVNIGADLGLITSQGVVPLSLILPLSPGGAAKVAATDKISGAYAAAYAGGSTSFGWQLIEYPKDRLLIANIPIRERAETHQYVMNTQTGAWCRFTGMEAGCWGLKGDELFFGGHDGVVYKYGGTYADDGDEINAVSVSAFTNLGSPDTKLFSMARPMLQGPADYLPGVALRTDYDLGVVTYQATTSVSLGSFWDESDWDVAEWALAVVNSAQWQSVTGSGSVVSVAMAVAVTEEVRFNAVDLMFENGGQL